MLNYEKPKCNIIYLQQMVVSKPIQIVYKFNTIHLNQMRVSKHVYNCKNRVYTEPINDYVMIYNKVIPYQSSINPIKSSWDNLISK